MARGPLDHFRQIGKGAGCDEVYWGEWMNHPPYCCDPCDDCGNWVGPCGRYCPQWLRSGWRSLWGQRYGECGQKAGCGCDSCGGKGHVVHEGEVIYEGPVQQAPLKPTSVLDLTGGSVEVLRRGRGDVSGLL